MKQDGTSIVRPEKISSSALNLPLVRQRYHCRPPWNPSPAVLRAVHAQLVVGQPLARCDLGRGRHLRCHGLRHPLVQVHDVVGGHLRQLVGGPRLQRERLILLPVRALVVVVGAQEGVDALRTVAHVVVGLARRVVPLVVLARARQRGQFRVNVGSGRACRRASLRRSVGGVERQRGRARKRSAHQHHGAEHVRPHERTPGRHRRAEVVSDHGRHAAVAESARPAPGCPCTRLSRRKEPRSPS